MHPTVQCTTLHKRVCHPKCSIEKFIFTRQSWKFDPFDLWKRSFRSFDHKNDRFDRKKVFFICFWQFSPFLCQKIGLLQSIFDLWKISTVIESIFRSHKTIDSIEKPMIEFPTLLKGHQHKSNKLQKEKKQNPSRANHIHKKFSFCKIFPVPTTVITCST